MKCLEVPSSPEKKTEISDVCEKMQVLIKCWDKQETLYIEPKRIEGAFLMFQVCKFVPFKKPCKAAEIILYIYQLVWLIS